MASLGLKKWKSVLYSAIVLAVAIIFGAVAAECYLQFTSPVRSAIPFYNNLYPYTMFRPIEGDAYISADKLAMSHFQTQVFHYTDENGFRVPSKGYSIPIAKAPGALRIAVLGGSTIQLGSTYETTLPGALLRALESKHPGRKIEVINAGIVSCVSRQSVAHFLFSVAKYRPDIVVLYDGVNDLGMPMTYESRANFPYNFQTMEAAWNEYRENRQDPLWRLALNRSKVFRALSGWASESSEAVVRGLAGPNALSARQVIEDHAYVESFVQAYLENWEIMIELSKAYGFRPLFVLQPTGGFDLAYSLPRLQKENGLSESTAKEWIQAFRVLYGEAERQMAVLRTTHPDLKFLNWSESLSPSDPYFWDLVHVYDETNDILAERMAKEMEPLLDERH